jgi:hypothetical protein
MLEYFSDDSNRGYILFEIPMLIVDTDDVEDKGLVYEYEQAQKLFDVVDGWSELRAFLVANNIRHKVLDNLSEPW